MPSGNTQGDVFLLREEWCVRTVSLATCVRMCREHHYARGGSNTAVFRHGLLRRDDPTRVWGIAWWIPPTRGAAEASWDGDWKQVLALSRLVLVPEAPRNAASFLIAASIDLIRRDGNWRCLITYADEWQGHNGTIYRATNWESLGLVLGDPTYVDQDGRMVARKAGPTSRSRQQMLAHGYREIGRYPKHKFRKIITPYRPEHRTQPPLLVS